METFDWSTGRLVTREEWSTAIKESGLPHVTSTATLPCLCARNWVTQTIIVCCYQPQKCIVVIFTDIHSLSQGAKFFLMMNLEGVRGKVYSTIYTALHGTQISLIVTYKKRVAIVIATLAVMHATQNMD